MLSVSDLTEISLPFCRSDKTLQDIVYKLVPGLFKSKSTTVKPSLRLKHCVYFHSDSAFAFSLAIFLLVVSYIIMQQY